MVTDCDNRRQRRRQPRFKLFIGRAPLGKGRPPKLIPPWMLPSLFMWLIVAFYVTVITCHAHRYLPMLNESARYCHPFRSRKIGSSYPPGCPRPSYLLSLPTLVNPCHAIVFYLPASTLPCQRCMVLQLRRASSFFAPLHSFFILPLGGHNTFYYANIAPFMVVPSVSPSSLVKPTVIYLC